MEEILLEHGEEKLRWLLTELNTVLIAIILLSSLIFLPRKRHDKPKVDPRLIVFFCGIFWCVASVFMYQEVFWNIEQIGWYLIDITIAVALMHLRGLFIKRRNGRT